MMRASGGVRALSRTPLFYFNEENIYKMKKCQNVNYLHGQMKNLEEFQPKCL